MIEGEETSVALKDAASAMSNIDSAKIFFGITLQRLQASFPAAVHLTPDDIWPEFERLAGNGELSLRHSRASKVYSLSDLAKKPELQQYYTRQMLAWMKVEGYLVSDPISNFKYDYILSSKSLALLNLSLSETEGTLGAKLKRVIGSIGDKAAGEIVSDLVGRAFEALQGLSP
ncbi:hypothetical protein ROA7745_01145 [Roseovarius aestuarii]|uniref:Uncharacterized protein n=1 Tax=Roseovarius aestuarii TaxID=475083 RepID=A0A1X7BNZ4_9RHOB|nr:hypothetical protein ROA7745_01145 [Roseovarius aestuarii]